MNTDRAILWDNDGVLVQTEHLYFKANQILCEELGFTLTTKIFIELFLKKALGLGFLLKEKGVEELEIKKILKQRDETYSSLLKSKVIVTPGIITVLEKLKLTHKMGIVTSCHRDHFELIHRNTGLLPYFDFILTREDYTKSKPDSEPYLTGLEKANTLAENTWVIEDSVRGFMAAKAAGIKCIVLANEYFSAEDFEGAYQVIQTVKEIPLLLET